MRLQLLTLQDTGKTEQKLLILQDTGMTEEKTAMARNTVTWHLDECGFLSPYMMPKQILALYIMSIFSVRTEP